MAEDVVEQLDRTLAQSGGMLDDVITNLERDHRLLINRLVSGVKTMEEYREVAGQARKLGEHLKFAKDRRARG